jgi:hypothetical protein
MALLRSLLMIILMISLYPHWHFNFCSDFCTNAPRFQFTLSQQPQRLRLQSHLMKNKSVLKRMTTLGSVSEHLRFEIHFCLQMICGLDCRLKAGIHCSRRCDTYLTLLRAAELHAIYDKVQHIHSDPSWYSKPSNKGKFPFLSLHDRPSERFVLSEGTFEYMGREQFGEVWECVKGLERRGCTELYIEGSMGFGKSHILAMLADLLYRLGKRTIYIPDCRQALVAPLAYLQNSLLVAFAEPSLTLERTRIRSCQSLSDILAFCRTQTYMYFITDQMNALDSEEPNMDNISNEAKRSLKDFFLEVFYGNFSITSASANYRTTQHLVKKQTSDQKISFMGGMSEVTLPLVLLALFSFTIPIQNEMTHWWDHHKANLPTFECGEKARVEDMTGRIPLLLRPLLKFKGKSFRDVESQFWSHPDLEFVGQAVQDYASGVRQTGKQLNQLQGVSKNSYSERHHTNSQNEILSFCSCRLHNQFESPNYTNCLA